MIFTPEIATELVNNGSKTMYRIPCEEMIGIGDEAHSLNRNGDTWSYLLPYEWLNTVESLEQPWSVGEEIKNEYLHMRVVDVRLERLMDITVEDVRKEGILDGVCYNCGEPEPCGCQEPRPIPYETFFCEWNKRHEHIHFLSTYFDPWVWVLEIENINLTQSEEPKEHSL